MGVYYNPEDYGLSIVAEIDYSSGSYEFDLRVVWRHEDGTLYTDRNSGCSCYAPWEGSTLNSLTVLDDIGPIQVEIDQELSSDYKYISQASALDFLGQVRNALHA